MIIEKVKIEKLKAAKYNPRKNLKPGDPEYEKLKKSMEEFDYIEPIVWNRRSGNIVGGHQRLKILKEKGYTEVEVSVVDLDDEKEKALNLALNKTGGDWDIPMLAEIIEELSKTDLDMDITGFNGDEIAEMLAGKTGDEIIEDDFDVESEYGDIVEPISKPGDVWVLGRHHMMCGDSTKLTDVKRLMGGETADMIFTDPPYNVAYEGKTQDKLIIENDKQSDGQFYLFLLDAYKCMFEVTSPGGAIYVCHADSEGVNFRAALKDAGFLLKQCLIWAKNSLVMGRQDYHWRHEPILYGWKPGAAHKFYGGRKQTTLIEDPFGVTITKEKGKHQIHIKNGLHALVLSVDAYKVEYASDDSETSLWRIERPTRSAEHPTMKPIAIPARAIKNSSKLGERVLDLFGGSGSTLIAAEQTGRCAYLMELDPKYADLIVKRWEEFTGQKAIKNERGDRNG